MNPDNVVTQAKEVVLAYEMCGTRLGKRLRLALEALRASLAKEPWDCMDCGHVNEGGCGWCVKCEPERKTP